MRRQVAVCGPGDCTDEEAANAYRVGQLLADEDVVVVCGGGGGVMAAAARGARSRNGLVIGVRPGSSRDDASPDLSAVIITNMGEARNAVIVWSADAVIAVGGSWGTLSEVAFARKRGITTVSLGGWRILGGDGKPIDGGGGVVEYVQTPEDAVQLALAASPRVLDRMKNDN